MEFQLDPATVGIADVGRPVPAVRAQPVVGFVLLDLDPGLAQLIEKGIHRLTTVGVVRAHEQADMLAVHVEGLVGGDEMEVATAGDHRDEGEVAVLEALAVPDRQTQQVVIKFQRGVEIAHPDRHVIHVSYLDVHTGQSARGTKNRLSRETGLSSERLPTAMLVLGDAHADDPARREALFAAYRAADEDRALQVGDLLCYDLPAPTWFVAGNNEDFDVIESLRRGDRALTDSRPALLASTAVELDGLRVAGLSGNYAPTRYDHAREELSGDRRRHFIREEVEQAMDLPNVDVLLTHEAPRDLLRRSGHDVGCDPINALLERLVPDLCLVGHYHEHVEGEFGETRVVSLAPAWEGYYTLDPTTLELDRHPTPQTE